MTHLVIENQNSNVEIVSVAIILKIYLMALSALGSVSLKGNLLSEHAKLTAYDYLTGNLTGTSIKRFPELSLNITGGLYIDFEDSLVEQILSSENIGDGIGITQSDLYEINRIEGSWFSSSNITSFNELQYFKPSAVNQQGVFLNCNHLTEVTLPPGITYPPIQCFKNDSLLETVNNTSSFTASERSSFEECSSLETIDLLNIIAIKQYSFALCGNLRSIGTGAPTTVEAHAFENCSSLTSIDLSNCTTIGSYGFKGCTSLQHIDFSQLPIATDNDAFYGCTSLGINETLEINAIRGDSNNHNQPSRTFYGTRYKRFIYHAPTITGILRSEYAIFDGMTDLEYLDISETSISACGGGVPNTLTTKIESPSAASIEWAAGAPSQYWIIPSTTMCTINNDFVRYNAFKSSKTSCILYVLDSTVRDAYLADSNWSLIANISDRIKTLAELPAGVWTTGLASQYLTPALLATS